MGGKSKKEEKQRSKSKEPLKSSEAVKVRPSKESVSTSRTSTSPLLVSAKSSTTLKSSKSKESLTSAKSSNSKSSTSTPKDAISSKSCTHTAMTPSNTDKSSPKKKKQRLDAQTVALLAEATKVTDEENTPTVFEKVNAPVNPATEKLKVHVMKLMPDDDDCKTAREGSTTPTTAIELSPVSVYLTPLSKTPSNENRLPHTHQSHDDNKKDDHSTDPVSVYMPNMKK